MPRQRCSDCSSQARRVKRGARRIAILENGFTLIQRFGSAANLNIHLHCLVLDGVYRGAADEAQFQEARAPNRAGEVVLQLKSAYRDGTTHIVMSPLEFMQRLAALVPRPRLHLIRFHGALAPHAKLRAAIVPGPPENTSEHTAGHAHGAPARMSWARLLKRVFDIDVEHCQHCGGALKIIAAIEEPAVIARILTHLGLPARAPPRSPARPLALFQAA